MRTLLALVFLSFVACTVQSTGARCEQNADCNTAGGDVCRRWSEPSQACGNDPSCICCPENAAAAALIPACVGMRVTADAGATADR